VGLHRLGQPSVDGGREADGQEVVVVGARRDNTGRMQALQFTSYGGPEALSWADAPNPHAGAGRVRGSPFGRPA
jgi:hypothetical protein